MKESTLVEYKGTVFNLVPCWEMTLLMGNNRRGFKGCKHQEARQACFASRRLELRRWKNHISKACRHRPPRCRLQLHCVLSTNVGFKCYAYSRVCIYPIRVEV